MSILETDTAGPAIQVDDLDADRLLSLIEDSETQSRIAERRKLRYAAHWCRLHPADAPDDEEDAPIGGPGTPPVAVFAAEPLGAALQSSTYAARQLMADAWNLTHRLPHIWARVESLDVPAWRARRIAQATAHLSQEVAATVDRELAPRAATCGAVLIDRAIATATAQADPEAQHSDETVSKDSWEVRIFHRPPTGPGRWAGTSILEITGDTLDLTRIHDQLVRSDDLGAAIHDLATGFGNGKPARTRLYLHADLTDLADDTIGTGSVERLGPLSTARIKDWAGHSHVTVLPVLRMDRTDAVDRHDPPAWMRELVILRDQHCVFPWCHTDARSCDLDHVIPYLPMDKGGPPGQTHPGNLAPLCRRHHRNKTRDIWTYTRNEDGTYTWTSPHHRRYAVTPLGTYQLG
ncbi:MULTISPECIES: HNH endonuclease signature motif containing protein [unclassified Nocardioides]|uniref:HNH endonuclease signature motif containing protein n=1 Tax=unclassified Nocardioides TaxID=2615069 RepID=UPI0009EFB2FC|nr:MULTISPECIES: HNH endonuclease signature motif containing protein [unclassified Nocardioides]GAW51636.1 HNH endonuclease (Precursor) [Nocardioides sp. PD653-B2]GAW56805.1 HNH endonuclease (Precursor) [Nocardioides sp. PD653]